MEHELPLVNGFPSAEKEHVTSVTEKVTEPVISDVTANVTEKVTEPVTTNYQLDNQIVSPEVFCNSNPVTFVNADITEFVTTLDVTSLKHQMRNWYKRRMNTPENMAKYKAGKTRLLGLGIPVIELDNIRLSFTKNSFHQKK